MPDREKVIRGLEHCKKFGACDGCPYNEDKDVDCGCDMFTDALALLREQEPVTPEHIRSMIRSFGSDGFRDECSVDSYKCGICHKAIEDTHSFCPHCGRRIKWD